MRFVRLSALALILTFTAPQAAKADYFVWNDPQTGVQITYPDTWKVVHSQDTNDVVTIMPPSGRANAQCRVRANDERRFLIYPPRYDAAIQKITFSRDFWDKYLHEYNNHNIEALYDGAGHGRGFASYTIATYDSQIPGPDMARRALMFVSHYNDTVYVTECSSHADAFEQWKQIFLSVAGSVEFRKAHHETT
ncbi:MAG: hypothetical protein KKA05_08635, partial [Alphaproteobacteria bacterium]|nr:hypothetical protein [Alphaproteobacteria bacterium]